MVVFLIVHRVVRCHLGGGGGGGGGGSGGGGVYGLPGVRADKRWQKQSLTCTIVNDQ